MSGKLNLIPPIILLVTAQLWPYKVFDGSLRLCHKKSRIFIDRKDCLLSEVTEEICNCNVYDDSNTGLRRCPV